MFVWVGGDSVVGAVAVVALGVVRGGGSISRDLKNEVRQRGQEGCYVIDIMDREF